jgi:hypothetical protein
VHDPAGQPGGEHPGLVDRDARPGHRRRRDRVRAERVAARPDGTADRQLLDRDRGAETAQFPVTGTGGPIPANQPIGGVLHGTWAPSVAGTDEVRGGDVAVTANVVLIGDVSLTCTPDEPRPVGATLTVQ